MKKTKKIFNFILCILPFIIIAFILFRNVNYYDLVSNWYTSEGYDLPTMFLYRVFNDIKDFFSPLYYNTPLFPVYDFFETYFFVYEEGVESIIFCFLSYYFWVQIISLLYDVLLFIIEWARKWLNNTFGKEN